MIKKENKISDALMKVALGCKVEEVTEEYSEVDGSLKLTKRKKTKKDIPPDLKAVQILLENDSDGKNYQAIPSLSDEELEKEKKRLLMLLSEKSLGQAHGNEEEKKTTAKPIGKLTKQSAQESGKEGEKERKTEDQTGEKTGAQKVLLEKNKEKRCIQGTKNTKKNKENKNRKEMVDPIGRL